jgi:hypothetical protein
MRTLAIALLDMARRAVLQMRIGRPRHVTERQVSSQTAAAEQFQLRRAASKKQTAITSPDESSLSSLTR